MTSYFWRYNVSVLDSLPTQHELQYTVDRTEINF